MSDIKLTILMPCLNEAETLADCIRRANEGLARNNVVGEILIADNGSTDGSRDIALRLGARIVDVEQQGYGAALAGGIVAARGQYIIMGDADASYDFSEITPFLEQLRSGADLVMGNRFRGGIEVGAMPFLHRYLGNPILSWVGRLFFRIPVGDFHCGLRGFDRKRILGLHLETAGMEFASEMVVKAGLQGYSIAEVPTILSRDGRSRPPHLRTWRDGWRHLSFMLMYSPRWLFLYPGLLLLALGIMLSVALFPGQISAGGIGFDIHTFIIACFSVVMATQAVSFAIYARRFASAHNLIPTSAKRDRFIRLFTLERVLVGCGCFVIVGLAGLIYCIWRWASAGFGPLEYSAVLRTLILSMTLMTLGFQVSFMAFFSEITETQIRK